LVDFNYLKFSFIKIEFNSNMYKQQEIGAIHLVFVQFL
jgi:hypothetical protein